MTTKLKLFLRDCLIVDTALSYSSRRKMSIGVSTRGTSRNTLIVAGTLISLRGSVPRRTATCSTGFTLFSHRSCQNLSNCENSAHSDSAKRIRLEKCVSAGQHDIDSWRAFEERGDRRTQLSGQLAQPMYCTHQYLASARGRTDIQT